MAKTSSHIQCKVARPSSPNVCSFNIPTMILRGLPIRHCQESLWWDARVEISLNSANVTILYRLSEFSLCTSQCCAVSRSHDSALSTTCNKPKQRIDECICVQRYCHFNMNCPRSKTCKKDTIPFQQTQVPFYDDRLKVIHPSGCERLRGGGDLDSHDPAVGQLFSVARDVESGADKTHMIWELYEWEHYHQ